jgi:hypothetical protein
MLNRNLFANKVIYALSFIANRTTMLEKPLLVNLVGIRFLSKSKAFIINRSTNLITAQTAQVKQLKNWLILYLRITISYKKMLYYRIKFDNFKIKNLAVPVQPTQLSKAGPRCRSNFLYEERKKSSFISFRKALRLPTA